MATNFTAHLSFASPEATSLFASTLAPLLTSGNVLLLTGEIGAGKTHFARSLIQTRLAVAGLLEEVPSPTFTLVQTYRDGIFDIWHTDLYRLSDIAEVAELGLLEAFQDAICLVEWPELLGRLRPKYSLSIRFEDGSTENSRRVEISGDPQYWSKVLGVIEASPNLQSISKATCDV